MGFLSNGELKERILDHVFTPLFKNNRTEIADSDSEDEAEEKAKFEKQLHYHRHVDGGKLHP